MPPREQTKIVIVEDHPMFRERLAALINKQRDLTVCGEVDNVPEALDMILKMKPGAVIVDVTLRGSSGLELIKDLKAHSVSVPVLVLSMHDELIYAERALRAGAQGYITKHEVSDSVMVALRRVIDGGLFFGERVTAKILGGIAGAGARPQKSGIETLTDRELEVFRLIGTGRSGREIAETLGVGLSTIDTYRARIKEKLGLASGVQLQHSATEWVNEQERPL